jgi:hypothetical protein
MTRLAVRESIEGWILPSGEVASIVLSTRETPEEESPAGILG